MKKYSNGQIAKDSEYNGHAIKHSRLLGCIIGATGKTLEDLNYEVENIDPTPQPTPLPSGLMKWKGVVESNPEEGNELGDVVRNSTDSKTYVYNGAGSTVIELADDSTYTRDAEHDADGQYGQQEEDYGHLYAYKEIEDGGRTAYFRSETPELEEWSYFAEDYGPIQDGDAVYEGMIVTNITPGEDSWVEI